MNDERLHRIIVEPRISEKATRVADANRQYVFRVLRDATKPEIKIAIERLFKVEVDNVRTLNVRGKAVRRRSIGQRSAWKKAYVQLKEGFDISFVGAE